MADLVTIDPNLTRADRLVLESLARDIRAGRDYEDDADKKESETADAAMLAVLDALNDPTSADFEPTVFTSTDLPEWAAALAAARKSGNPLQAAAAWVLTGLQRAVLDPYIRLAQRHVVRHPTDVVFLTHLLFYGVTLVPSALVLLLVRFAWWHGLAHAAFVLGACIGPYTILMHQHIHQGGVLRKGGLCGAVDYLFPLVLDPLMGHTWNSYYYHHVKHHHVEGNGPDDLSSTMRFRRDSLLGFAQYLGRFLLLAWFDLPRYFWRTRRYASAVRAGAAELASYALMAGLCWLGAHGHRIVDWRAPLCALVIPFCLLRVGLMLGNWGQHAFVDPDAPASDFRSSVTVIDVASNRVCFNDGYHTSHHLNPRRHWRDHPRAFARQKRAYAAESAFVFIGVDYLFLSLRLLFTHDYDWLARHLVPLGPHQCSLTLDERAAWLRRCAQPFSEADIARLYPKSRSAAVWRRKHGQPAE